MTWEKSESQNSEFKKGDKFILELGKERRMFGEFEIAGTDLYVRKDLLEKLTPYKPTAQSEPTFEQIKEYCDRRCMTIITNDLYCNLTAIYSRQPKIIHCRDCRYYQDNNGGYPHMNCKWDSNETPDADDFCSGAERRGNG